MLIYRGSPTSTNFSAIGIKFVLVELLCSKIRTSGNRTSGDRTIGGPPVPERQ